MPYFEHNTEHSRWVLTSNAGILAP